MNGESVEAIALFRYRIIGEATSSRLSPAERGRIVRDLARRVYEHPDGSQRQYTRGTLDRWIRAYREQGLSGLKPEPRSDLGTVRRHPELLDEALRTPSRAANSLGRSDRRHLVRPSPYPRCRTDH